MVLYIEETVYNDSNTDWRYPAGQGRKNMRKIIVILLAALIFAACTSYPVDIEKSVKNIVVWNDTLPKEESIVLFFPSNMTVTSYNGINVKWKNTAVYLPPGKVSMDIVVQTYESSYVITERNLLFERTFKAGERYSLVYQSELCLDLVKLMDLNEKKAWKDQIVHYFPRMPKTILPGASGGGTRQTGEVTIVFGEGILVINCNGKYVYDEYYSSKENNHVWSLKKETLPAGPSTINFDVYYVNHKINLNVITMLQNLEFTWNFEAGKEYTIAVDANLLNPFVTEYIVAIYNFASKTGSAGSASQIVKSWKFGEFNKPAGKFTWFSPETGKPIEKPAK